MDAQAKDSSGDRWGVTEVSAEGAAPLCASPPSAPALAWTASPARLPRSFAQWGAATRLALAAAASALIWTAILWLLG